MFHLFIAFVLIELSFDIYLSVVKVSIYRPPTEHVRTVHCDSSYHGLVSGGGAEAGNVPIQAMVGASPPGYPGDKGRACRSRGGGGDGYRKNGGRGIVG